MSASARKGVYFAIIPALISGISIFVNKFAVGAITPPLLFTTAKNVGVALVLLVLLLARSNWYKIRALSKSDFLKLCLIGLVGGSVPFYLFFTGLAQIPAISSAIIHKTLVIWVALLAVPLLKEKVNVIQGIGVLLLFASNFVVGGFKGFEFSVGEVLTLAATLLWAGETILVKKLLPKIDSDLVALFRMGVGALVLMMVSALTVPSAAVQLTVTQTMWLGVTMVCLAGYVLSWYKALKYAPAVVVTSVLVLSTLVTNVLSAVFITHSWSFSGTLHGGLIVLGLVGVCSASGFPVLAELRTLRSVEPPLPRNPVSSQ